MGFFNSKTIKASIVFEMLGKPKEHLMQSIEQLIAKLQEEKDITITKKDIHNAKEYEVKDEKGNLKKTDLFSTFAEVELETEKLQTLYSIVFKFMPSHFEITSPDHIDFSNFDLNGLMNDLITRLHHYDSISKTAIMQNQMLAKRIMEMQNQGKIDEVKVIEKSQNKKAPKKKKA